MSFSANYYRPTDLIFTKHIIFFLFLFTGAVNSTGKLWESQRKFLHLVLRHMGMTFTGHNRLNMENRIMVSKSVEISMFTERTLP